ncbi:MAG TPA: CpaF family protein [bacterium]|nr:CpaF family protein [bacterium]HOY62487.1 CpaF family protein [bacterium]HPN92943.1 CpaF family protein [bacterium]
MGLLDRVKTTTEKSGPSQQQAAASAQLGAKKKSAAMTDIRKKALECLIEELGEEILYGDVPEERARKAIFNALENALGESDCLMTNADRDGLLDELCNEVMGLGPIEPLVRDPEISEIMVNGPKNVYVERKGRIIRSDMVFRDNAHVLRIIEKIVSPIGRRIDESSPMVDARLKDGSRVNAVIAPLSLVGPCLTIRKFSKDPLQVEDLIRFGTLTAETAALLKACVEARMNIIVSGGTGSGKTTTLNVLSSFIPSDERIVTIEDAAEIQLRQEHVVTLESRPPNIEGKGTISIRDLVRNCLRMRPDRIIVGEVRGGEALDMLQAMNTGHDGSLTTGHSNSPRDMLARLETMVLMAGMELPLRAIREQISSAIDLIIHQERMRDGKRRITHITEVAGMENEIITLQDIFKFQQKGVDENGGIVGEFKALGIVPKFVEKFKVNGIKLPLSVFHQK